MMVCVYFLMIVLSVIEANIGKNYNSSLRIYGGAKDEHSKYGYVVSLMSGGSGVDGEYLLRICSGTLIQQDWVLSAAHCLVDQVKYIQFGNMLLPLSHTDTKCKVLQKIPHPHFLLTAARNDIGLLLVTPVSLSKYGSISAVDYKTLPGHAVEFAGYGSTFFSERNIKNKLMLFVHDIVRPLQVGEAVVKTCDVRDFSKDLICLSPKCARKQTVLPGDSGGPLFFEDKIVGVACAITLDYSEQSFTPVSPYLTWIVSVVTSNNHDD